MKILIRIIPVFLLLGQQQLAAYDRPEFPFAPGALIAGTTAVHKDDPRVVSWATAVEEITYGEEVADEWKIPGNALGPASGIAEDVVVLGRGGEIVLSFEGFIPDGPGDDFAVYENALDDTFLELAFVEVSSDGIHYVRFPNYSMTAEPVGGFGILQPTHVHGYGGKYRAGYGTPFDLALLHEAYAAAVNEAGGFSPEFRSSLLDNYPYLDFEKVSYVRLIDIPGDGNQLDCEGFSIYDPYPTIITSGFDLDAVAVLQKDCSSVVGFEEWSAGYGLDPDPGSDTDGDKWAQYMEYLFGTNPTLANSKPVLESDLRETDGELALRISYSRRHAGCVEQVPQILVSPDKRTWRQWEGARFVSERESDNGMVSEWIELPLDTSGSPVWVRLSASY